MPYDRSAAIALASVVHEPFVQTWRTTGKPDPSYPLYRYPAKVIGSLLSGCAMYAKLSPRPADAEDAIAIARSAADYLISISAPPDAALAFMPPTYRTDKPTDREDDRWTMMMTPAEAGQGYLDVFDATNDRKYLDAAHRIADTYVKRQLPSGTWHLKVNNRTGEPVAPNLLIPSAIVRFLDRAGPDYAKARDRAVEWILSNPGKTFDWSAQFDDAKVRKPYENLSKHEACEFATYLFAHNGHIDKAEEILRFAEDQFVVWENPPQRASSSSTTRKSIEQLDPKHWITPSSTEQYAMFEPISGSSAAMITAYVHAHRATHQPLYLAKAKALADALTIAQQKNNGRYPTRMIEQDLQYWLNSTVNTARSMQLLVEEH